MEKSTTYATANSIPQFAGKEVEKWRIRMLSYFRRMRWMDVLETKKTCLKNAEKIDPVEIVTLEDDGKMQTRSKVKEKSADPTAESDDWNARNLEAMDFIMSKVHDDYLYLIAHKNTAREMWNAILTSFQKTSKETAASLRSEIFEMKYDLRTPLKEYLNQYTRKMETLRNLGDRLSNEDLMRQLLRSLPKEFISLKVTMLDKNLENMPWEKFISYVTTYGKEINPEAEGLEDFQTPITSFNTFSNRGKFNNNNNRNSYFRGNDGKGRNFGQNLGGKNFGQNFGNRNFGQNSRFRNNNNNNNNFDRNFRGNNFSNQNYNHSNDGCSNNYGDNRKNGSNRHPCHRCGKVGHFRKDCSVNLSNYNANSNSGRHFSNFANNSAHINTSNFVNDNSNGSNGDKENNVCLLSAEMASGELEINANIVENLDVENKNNKIQFWIDTAATRHIVNSEKFFDSVIKLKTPIVINVAKNGTTVKAEKIGNIKCTSMKGFKMVLRNVLFAPDLPHNLLSFSRLDRLGYSLEIKQGIARIRKEDNNVIFEAKLTGRDLYEANFNVNLDNISANIIETGIDESLWHKRYGHLNSLYLERLIKNKLVEGMDKSDIIEDCCEACLRGKGCRSPFKSTRPRATQLLERIHSDVCGPLSPVSGLGNKYFVTFIDDFSHFAVVYPIKEKSEVYNKFMEYVSAAEVLVERKVKAIRCDQGGEYKSKNFIEFCKSKGIVIDYVQRYTPEQNGVAERFNRSVVEKFVTMLYDSKLPKTLWDQALETATYLLNRSPTSALDSVVPATLWYKTKPNVKNLRIFGSLVFVQVPQELRKKLDSHVEKAAIVGIRNSGYMVWNKEWNRVLFSRDIVRFQENKMYMDESENKNQQCSLMETEKMTENFIYKDEEIFWSNIVAYGTIINENEIKEKSDFDSAIRNEIKAFDDTNAWELVDRPENKKVLTTRWIFREKSDGTNNILKARLVARGFEKLNEDIDQIRAPVAKLSTFRMFLSVCCKNACFIKQIDIKNAYLNGKLMEDVYIEIPKYIQAPKNKVFKLKKAMYGLKEAALIWNREINSVLEEIGFIRSTNDYCLYTSKGKEKCYLLLYVDDILIGSENEDQIENVIKILNQKFKIHVLGIPSKFLGMLMHHSPNRQQILLSQENNIEVIIKEFDISTNKQVLSPMQNKLKLEPAKKGDYTEKFQKLLGSLMYIMLCTRPDLCFCITYFSQFQKKADVEHYNYLTHMVEYLYSTKNLKLKFCMQDNVKLEGYADADFANNLRSKSITGYCFKSFGNMIVWRSIKQSVVALSTTEAEIISLCAAICESIHLKKCYKDFGIEINESVTVFEDNEAAIKILNNYRNNSRCKHLTVRVDFILDWIEKGEIELRYIRTKLQLADVFTKSFPAPVFVQFLERLNLTN